MTIKKIFEKIRYEVEWKSFLIGFVASCLCDYLFLNNWTKKIKELPYLLPTSKMCASPSCIKTTARSALAPGSEIVGRETSVTK